MPSPTASAGTYQGPGGPAAAPPTAAAPLVPFDQAAPRGLEAGPVYPVTPTTSQQTLGPSPLPAQGYLRRVVVDISASGGTAGAGTVSADYPFDILNLVRLQDTNGAPLCELS